MLVQQLVIASVSCTEWTLTQRNKNSMYVCGDTHLVSVSAPGAGQWCVH